MMSMCASTSGDKSSHDEWLGKLYFYRKLESPELKNVIFENQSLLSQFDDIPETRGDKIRKIYVYKSSLSRWQLTNFLLYHAFVILKTGSWYYSIETSKKNITMQRARTKSPLLNKCDGVDRIDVEFVTSAKGEGLIRDVLVYLQERNRLNLPYNLLVENCKDLAKYLFDEFNCESKRLDLTFTSYNR